MPEDARKILVVDNDPFMLKLIGDLLLDEGHQVTTTADAVGCLDLLSEMVPDIIFVDLVMPVIGGDDFCRVVRSMEWSEECYLVVVTGVALEHAVDHQEFGADLCIAKGPFQEMARHIKNAVRKAGQPRRPDQLSEVQGIEQLHPRQITRELLQRNQHLKVILECMSQGILELLGGRVVFVNRRGSEMLGLPFERLVGSHFRSVLPDSLATALEDSAGEAGPDGRRPVEVQFAEHQFTIESFPLSDMEQGRLVILTDITESKRMESIIEAANLTENLGYVFSGIRHEIGNPVNSIKMALSVLQRNLPEYDLETVADFLDRSLQEIARIEYLLKALKSYSLFETPELQVLQVNEFVSDFINLVHNDFRQHNITILPMLPTEGVYLRGDPRALHQVLLNLFANAADALEQVENPRIVVSVLVNDQQVALKIDDNGKGIPVEDQQHLFKPFFTSKAAGTGLGLVIVRKMLSAMNGTIGVESYRGIGTTVTICLPRVNHGQP